MSSSIDYFETTVLCPHCNAEIEVNVTREQDNTTCQIYTSIPYEIECDNCEKTFTSDIIKQHNEDVFDNLDEDDEFNDECEFNT